MQDSAPSLPAAGPQTLRDLTSSVAHQLAQGASQTVVIGQLVARGWPEFRARQFVVNAAQVVNECEDVAEERHYMAQLNKRRMQRGLMWALGGLTVTLLSLSLSRAYGGAALLCFGAIIFGCIDFIAGLIGWWRYRR